MPSGASTPPSALQIVARAAAGGAGLCAQLGLVVASVVLWRVLWLHPAGILLLQPQPPSAAHKRKGLQAHQALQYASLVSIVAGASFIFYNKAIHGAKHFTTWHATFGLITLSLIFCQIVFGALVVYSPLQHWLGGEGRAKALWKYHRMSGYLTLSFLVATPLLALVSTWVQSNSSAFERVLIGSGIALAGAGAFMRIQTSKLGFRR
ncbi:hypothetical protein Rhopal_000677-T1 [Rhodotorula paludigena]|uniref:Cytochrome b561 domain-containing protein n=1 Tax=Rhodotorula paludigena TaxID=86838 RepID=A0AAV5GEG1_9BASI|nr:hypothetical protein Rhopal_000677-T1 [Rhodotorula paludigena]